MRSGDRLWFRASVAFDLCPDPDEGGQGPIIVEGEPSDVVLLRLWVWLRRVLGKAIERDQAAVFRLQPAAPVRGGSVADVGDRRAGPARRGRAIPRPPLSVRTTGAG